MPTVEFPLTAAGNDGYAKKSATTYTGVAAATVVAGTGIGSEAALRNFVTPNYVIGVALFRWDTSSIPDGETVTGARIRFWQVDESRDAGSPVMQLQADWYDFGGTTDATDWVQNIANPNALAGVSLPPTDLTGRTRTIELENAAANINKVGFTGLRFGISRRDGATDTAPIGVNRVNFTQWGGTEPPNYNGATSLHKPYLIVDYGTVDNPPAAPTGLTATLVP